MKTITANEQQYTKHYYVEGQRIASKIGGGFLNAPVHTITDKLNLMDAKKTGIKDYEHFGEKLWAMLERQFECVEQKSGYVEYDGRLDNIIDLAEADAPEEQQYFYHPNHLGSSSFITDASGDAHQHLQYLPFGEDFISQRIDWQTRYTFSAKEKDKNTGYHYFGARYYDSEVSVWLSVDPMSDVYPYVSPYNYALSNPVSNIDPNGKWVKGAGLLRNIFKSDERILAEDQAAKYTQSTVSEIDGGWRASWYEDETAHYDNGASTASTFGFAGFLKSERKERKTGVRIFGNRNGTKNLKPAKNSSFSQDYYDPILDQKSDWLRRLFRRFKRNRGGDGPQYPPEEKKPYPVIINGKEKIVDINGNTVDHSKYLNIRVDSSDGLFDPGDTIIIRDNSYY